MRFTVCGVRSGVAGLRGVHEDASCVMIVENLVIIQRD